MKFVFYDLNEDERDIVLDILRSYNVVTNLTSNEVGSWFSRSNTYDISIDVELPFYDFLKKEVDEKLKYYEDMEHTKACLDTLYEQKTASTGKNTDSKPQRSRKKVKSSTEDCPPDAMCVSSFLQAALDNLLCNAIGESSSMKEVQLTDLPDDIRGQIVKRICKDGRKMDDVKIFMDEHGNIQVIGTSFD